MAHLTQRYEGDFLFRGQGNSTWPLTTTLERATTLPISAKQYYRLALRVRSEIESATNSAWNEIPSFTDIANQLADYDSVALRRMGHGLPAFEYLGYLRHHGFPSPLLDWTRSPYVAAFFAFNRAFRHSCDTNRAIFVFSKRPRRFASWSSDEPGIFDLGWRVGRHQRHFLQRSAYTICLQYAVNRHEWDFASHEDVFADPDAAHPLGREQDFLWKIILPGELRLSVLKELDLHNLNAFSLFASDDALMETLAVREMEFDQAG